MDVPPAALLDQGLLIAWQQGSLPIQLLKLLELGSILAPFTEGAFHLGTQSGLFGCHGIENLAGIDTPLPRLAQHSLDTVRDPRPSPAEV